ncbi:MAG: four helix bundle protein [Bacteroidetes bacterium]|nr:MAG: four helix bundle protein [Bacteroidota bacterium]
MAKIERFEDLHCWQNARILTAAIYRAEVPDSERDWATRNQLRRASLSIMNNLAEGFSRFSVKEQIRFFEIAQSSAAEVKSMLFLFEDLNYLPTEVLQQFHQQVEVTRSQTLGFIRYLNQKQ